MATTGGGRRSLIAAFLVAFGWSIAMCGAVYSIRSLAVAPTTPNEVLGLVHPTNQHGTILYVTAVQSMAFFGAFATGMPFFLAGYLLAPKKDSVVRRGFLSISWRWKWDDPTGRQWGAGAVGLATGTALTLLGAPLLLAAMDVPGPIPRLFGGG